MNDVAHDRIVVDASALVLAFTDGSAAGAAARERLRDRDRHAPHLVDAEVGNVLRRMALRGDLTEDEANESRILARAAVTVRHPHHGPIGDRAWVLRHNLTFYDALYVGVAELLETTLVTADARIRDAKGPSCPIEVLP